MTLPQISVVGPADQIHPPAPQPLEIIRAAIATGNVEMYRDAVSLMKEMDAFAARKAFNNALADAKAKIPVILKNREVDFTSSKGRTYYKYEDLAEIARVVTPLLAEHGLSYRFRATSNLNEPVVVTCIISHRDGHFEEITLTAGRDESGNKNSIQAVGSTLTYLQRMTLKAALGLAASEDDDGRASEQPTTISALQLKELEDLAKEVGADIEKACKHLKIESLAAMPANKFDRARAALEAKRAQ